MSSIPKADLHAKVLTSIGMEAEYCGSLEEVPFKVYLPNLGGFAFYAFTLTSPPGGRPTGEYKIQLIGSGQKRGQRGNLHLEADLFSVILGWSPDENIFVLWDAYAHESFAYSQNLQVKGSCIWLAQTNGMSTSERRLRRGRGIETVIACKADHFLQSLQTRIHYSAHRISAESSSV